jgi:hypothetical protein
MAEVAAAEQPAAQAVRLARPYPPSWVDRLTDWVRRLPVPSWAFYLGLGLALLLLELAAKFADRTYTQIGDIRPIHVLFVLNAVYYLALFHYLDWVAGRALAAFRPSLIGDEAQYQALHYQLTTLPARPAFLASIAGAVYGVVLYFVTPAAIISQAALLTSPAAIALEVTTNIIGWCAMGAFLYHTVRQLRLVSRIYAQHTRINIFGLGSLYAFSWLTARTAVGIILNLYAWAAFYSADPARLENVAIVVVGLVVAVLTFAWPLLGVHQLLVVEKARRRTALAQRMDATIAELHRRTDAGEFERTAEVNGTLDGLLKEQSVLDKISTWPWQPGTLGGLATAILLPLLLWFITRLLERLVTF